MGFSQNLERIGACGPAVRWARGRSIAKAWSECSRADWMVWFLSIVAVGVAGRIEVRFSAIDLIRSVQVPVGLGLEWRNSVHERERSLMSPTRVDPVLEATQVAGDVASGALYLAAADRDRALGVLGGMADTLRVRVPVVEDPGVSFWRATC